ncbi:cytochrome P450 [Pseudomassariella vexata]|uniref:Cytochrome P450 monooxygenase ABA1 n=1 Tax=Pseudomassariella vexata TaxID=1141098 RepID=A0A1Y2DH72_9PEZI|nr:cytochrome P450 [Pseudomassariella vexata]ORY58587.1 cytochrome P450 [Pseudomassariella vexata]
MAIPILEILSHPYLPAALAISTLIYIIYSYTKSYLRLSHIPGPPFASLTYFYLIWHITTYRQSAHYRSVNERYGHLARIGPNQLLTDDPEVLRRMGAARSTYSRSEWYDAARMDPYRDTLFSIGDTDEHDRLKAKLSFGYGGKENPGLEDGIDEQLNGWVALIRRKYVSTDEKLRPMDLATTTQYFTLDALTKIAFGRAFGYLSTDSDVNDYIKEVAKYILGLVLCTEVPWLRKILTFPLLLKYVGPKPTDKAGYGKMLAVAEEIIRPRFEPGAKDHQDMLGSFIRHGVSRRDCQAEALFQIIAGSDTTATAMRGTMLNLMTAPHAYYTLQQEIDDAIAKGAVSNPAKADEGRQLPYLQAVIYEGLRINIPFSGLVSKKVPPRGDTILGHFVPGGTRIGHSTLSVQRSKSVFGDDADLFRPERWLHVNTETLNELKQHVELVFGYGRWGCSGKSVAFMELNKVYIELLRRFNFQLIDPMHPMNSWNNNMFFQDNMWVKVTERFPDTKT